jgi:hypothetical protein
MVAGNISFTEYCGPESVHKIIAQWYSGSGSDNGVAYGTTTNFYDGYVVGAFTITSNTPQNAYNVAAYDQDGHDVLMGACNARTNTVNIYQYIASANIAAVSHSKLNFAITNANFNRNGTAVLYIR